MVLGSLIDNSASLRYFFLLLGSGFWVLPYICLLVAVAAEFWVMGLLAENYLSSGICVLSDSLRRN